MKHLFQRSHIILHLCLVVCILLTSCGQQTEKSITDKNPPTQMTEESFSQTAKEKREAKKIAKKQYRSTIDSRHPPHILQEVQQYPQQISLRQ